MVPDPTHESDVFHNNGNEEGAQSSESDVTIVPPCDHETCRITNYSNDAKVFRDMTVTERLTVVRGIIYATASGAADNELDGNKEHTRLLKRRRNAYAQNRALETEFQKRSQFVYAVRGQRLCRPAFAHLTCLSEHTITRHARIISSADAFVPYETKLRRSHLGCIGTHRQIVDGYLNHVSTTYALECPTGRGSREGDSVMLLPSDMTKLTIYEDYVDLFPSLREAVTSFITSSPPDTPLTLSAFTRYWEKGHHMLKVAKTGSDFCDYCTTLRNNLQNLDKDDDRYDVLSILLNKHRDNATKEHQFYRECLLSTQDVLDGSQQHLVFDFAEKVLLPRLLRQPGQLYFVTGLKFDLFGVHDSNNKRTLLFGLPEGHWPNEKTANCVVSMLHYAVDSIVLQTHSAPVIKKLSLHADNCAGQNKNRFILMYLCWRVIVRLSESIFLHFMIAGHTKNVVDGAFGHVKRKLKIRDTRTPREMMSVIEDSSENSLCIPSADVLWRQWKVFLEKFFKIPNGFSITKFHTFRFSVDGLGKMYVREYSFSEEEKEFSILRHGMDVATVRHKCQDIFLDDEFASSILPLENVKSAQQGTRREYLVHNITRRYYPNDVELSSEFFKDGTGG